ncbi:probable collagen alpha-5(VI) chain at N-terminal half [Coccomyxa sp. Obi]|nr:probable collagen alpha-5(VI) chain at N-terminal half [Coccomyxa sp. Obi]
MYRGGNYPFGARPPFHPGLQQGWTGGPPEFPLGPHPPPYGPPGAQFAGPPDMHMQQAYDFQHPPWAAHPGQPGPAGPGFPGPRGPRPPPGGRGPPGRHGGRTGGRGLPGQTAHNGGPPGGPGRGFGGRGVPHQGWTAGREGMLGRTGQRHQQQPKQPPKQKKQKEMKDTPAKPWRPLNEQEVLDGARWREERRKAYPSEANVAARRAEAAERRARGELDPAREASRLRLREVIARQRDLGLLREAGTADLLAEAGLADSHGGSGFRDGRGRRGRFGRQPGPGRGGRGGRYDGRGDGGWKRRAEDFQPPGSEAGPPQKLAKPDAESGPPLTEGLEVLMAYGSDSETDAVEQRQGLHADDAMQEERPSPQGRGRGGRDGGRDRGRGRHGQRGRHPRQGGRTQAASQQQQQRRQTLLQKLLAPDIRAEHSRLLQCLRFLVTNNFLLDYGRAPLIFPPQPAAPANALPELPAELLQSESDDETEAPDNLTKGDAAATTAARADAEESEAESSSGEEEESEEEEDSEEEEGSGDEDEGKCAEINVGIGQTSAATGEPVDSEAVEGLQAVVAAEAVSIGLEAVAA